MTCAKPGEPQSGQVVGAICSTNTELYPQLGHWTFGMQTLRLQSPAPAATLTAGHAYHPAVLAFAMATTIPAMGLVWTAFELATD